MGKRIFFGSMLVIFCLLLIPSTSALQEHNELKGTINFKLINNIKSMDYDQLLEFLTELSKDYPLVHQEVVKEFEDILDQEIKDLSSLEDSNQSFIEKVWYSILNYRGFRLYLSLCLFAHSQSKIILMRSITWGIKLLRWVNVGIVLGIIDLTSEEPPETPEIIFIMDNMNNELQVASAPYDVYWEDIEQIGPGTCDPLPTGYVMAGDIITNCMGTIILRYIPTNEVIGVYEF